MSILRSPVELKNKSALIVGVGGLGCPAALALARAGIGRLVLCDDDIVDITNLHRQVLFDEGDVGCDKLDVARKRLLREGAREVDLIRSRLLPDLAREMVRDVDVVLEGTDNFPSKFLAADACYLERTAIVHGAAIRFVGTALSIAAQAAPCYRCLFEDLLDQGKAPNCTEAGVVGPVVGVVGALMADLALDVLMDDPSRQGVIYSFDGKRVTLRPVSVPPRADCMLCGTDAPSPISEIHLGLYLRDHLGCSSPAASAPSQQI